MAGTVKEWLYNKPALDVRMTCVRMNSEGESFVTWTGRGSRYMKIGCWDICF